MYYQENLWLKSGFTGWEYSQFVKCPAFTAQHDITMQDIDIFSLSSELTLQLQGLKVWGQDKTEIITETSQVAHSGLFWQEGWGGSRSVSPPGLYLCKYIQRQEQPPSLRAEMWVQEPSRNGPARASKWTEPAQCHELVLTTELPCGF